MTTDLLKPCPFCSDTDIEICEALGSSAYCTTCGAAVEGDTPDDARRIWNTRADSPDSLDSLSSNHLLDKDAPLSETFLWDLWDTVARAFPMESSKVIQFAREIERLVIERVLAARGN